MDRGGRLRFLMCISLTIGRLRSTGSQGVGPVEPLPHTSASAHLRRKKCNPEKKKRASRNLAEQRRALIVCVCAKVCVRPCRASAATANSAALSILPWRKCLFLLMLMLQLQRSCNLPTMGRGGIRCQSGGTGSQRSSVVPLVYYAGARSEPSTRGHFL